MVIREFRETDVLQMIHIWNEIVQQGNAFPQEEYLDEAAGLEFFKSQSYTAVAELDGEIAGLYILHPNNVGRCGHICNASYAVAGQFRGMHIGESLVRDCIEQGKMHAFKILQFNAVVADNTPARKLYEKIGFKQLGTISGGFRLKSGTYADICPYYIEL